MIQINLTQFDELSAALDQAADDLADDLRDAVDEVSVLIAEEARLRAPVNPGKWPRTQQVKKPATGKNKKNPTKEVAPTLQFQIKAEPVVRTGNVARAEVVVGGNAADHAALQHELLEVGESDHSYDPDADQPRRQPGDPIWRLGRKSVLKDRASDVKVGGQFLSRAVSENEQAIQEIFESFLLT